MLELHVEMICNTLVTKWKGSSVPVDVFLLPSVVGLKVAVTGAGNPVTIQSTWRFPLYLKVGPLIQSTACCSQLSN